MLTLLLVLLCVGHLLLLRKVVAKDPKELELASPLDQGRQT